nr:putative ribonuclease H-like domain-containing protein [Tanacetum cinerariifolium]
MAIPDEHLARFHGIKDDKTLWAAIKTRFDGVSIEDANQKFLRSLPLAQSNISLIMRSKPGIDNLDINDLYNNLKVYEADIKGSYGSSSNSQSVDLVFVESTNITNELNAAYSVSTATGHSSQAQGSSSYVDELMFSFFATKSNTPQMDNEDLEQINHDDLEEMDLKWQVAMLSMRVKLSVITVIEEGTLPEIADQPRIRGTGVEMLGMLGKKEEIMRRNQLTFLVWLSLQIPQAPQAQILRFKKGKGYHAVPPPLTGNYMPPKPDLSFAGLDDSIYKFKISETVTSLAKDDKDAPKTSAASVEKPKDDRFSAPLIQDWETNSDNDSIFRPEPIPAKIDFVKADRMAKKSVLPTIVGKRTGHKESRPVWNNVQRINNQNKFASTAVFIRSGRIPVSATKPKAAASTSATKPVNTARPTQRVNFSKSRSTFRKSNSPIRMSFYNATAHLRRNSTERVNTAGSKGVSAVKENGVAAVKTLAGCVWRPTVNDIDQLYKDNRWIYTRVDYGHTQQALKNKGIVDSGCSRNMTRNKAYLTDYQEINDGGFVAFGSSRGKISGKGNQTDKNAGLQDTNGNAGTQDNVDVGKEASDQHYIVLPLWSSISFTFKSSDDKATDDKPTDHIGSKNVEEPVNKEDQAYRDELRRLMSQEKEAINTASTSETFSATGPSSPHPNAFIPANTLLHVDQDDSKIPDLEDTTELQSTGIFNSAYDDDLDIFDSLVQSVGAEADFNNMESSTIVSPISTLRVHLDHPKDQILGDPKSAVQTRGMARNSFRAHALVYVDDIIFGSTKKSLCDEFEALMHTRFQMSSMGELTFFLGLQVKQSEKGIFIRHDKYVAEILKKFDFSSVKTTSTPIETQMPLVKDEDVADVTPKLTHLHAVKRIFWYLKGQPKLGLWYPRDSPFDLEAFLDSDYAGENLDRKSITRGCQFLGRRLISWQCKKQTIVATSTTKVEYVVTANCCGQILNTATSKTVNSVKQIHATVDGNAMAISKSSMRSDLLFNDKDGIACLTTAEIFENLAFMGYEQISTKLTFQKGSFSPQWKFLIHIILHCDRTRCQENTLGDIDAQTSMEHQDDLMDVILPTPHDSPLLGGHTSGSDEGRPNLLELMNICTQLSNRVLALEEAKTIQDKVITRLKLRVRRQEKKRKARTSQPMKRRLLKGRVETSTEKSLEDKGSGEKGGSTADQVSTARPEVSTATLSTPPPTTTIFDKGKGVLVEEELEKIEKVKRMDQAQIESDAELAKRIYKEELAELDRTQKERQNQEEATIAALTKEFDEIQARMDDDHELAVRMTHEKQEKCTIKERARLLVEYFKRRKKQLAVERGEAIRNKPPIRTQVRNMMITYLKHMGKYTHKQLKHKTFEELQKLYQKEQKWIDDFVPMDSKKEEKTSVESENKGKKGKRIKRIIGNVDTEDVHVYKIIRASGNTSYHKSLSSMLRKFDRQDLVDLHRLVMKRFEDNTLEVYNLLLWGDLKFKEGLLGIEDLFYLILLIMVSVADEDM